MAAATHSSRHFLILPRHFVTTSSRRVRFGYSSPAVIREIGKLTPVLPETTYPTGQLFIHRTFAYRGIVLCSFNCRHHEKKEGSSDKVVSMRDYYQVLIHKPDWPHMQFPVDLTSYLQDGSNRGEKYFANINGMDCISHKDLIPFVSTELAPIEHDLFDKIFMRDKEDSSVGRLVMRPNLRENYMASQRSWMAPRDVYREITEGIEVTVTTFYLGVNLINGQQRHMWRYTIRIENHVPQKPVILRERTLKIYALNNMNQANGHGVVGKQPELNINSPAFQFSSTIEMPHAKGCHMWGSFRMERDNGSTFNVTIPTIVLESQEERNLEAGKMQE